MQRGEIWWANLREPLGSEPGYRRPVLIVSSNRFNGSHIQTVLAVVLTTNLALADAPGNVRVSQDETGLPKDSVVNITQLITIDKAFLSEYVGELKKDTMKQVARGLRLVMDL